MMATTAFSRPQNRSSSSGARPLAAIVFRTRLGSEARKAAVGTASVRFVTRGMLRELTQQELDSWRSSRYKDEETSLRVSRSLLEATGMSGGQFGILSILAQIPQNSMRQQEGPRNALGSNTFVARSTRMEARGWIKRMKGGKGQTLVLLEEVGRTEQHAVVPVLAEL